MPTRNPRRLSPSPSSVPAAKSDEVSAESDLIVPVGVDGPGLKASSGRRELAAPALVVAWGGSWQVHH